MCLQALKDLLDELLPLIPGSQPIKPSVAKQTAQVSAKANLVNESKTEPNGAELDHDWLAGTNINVTEKVRKY